MKKTKLLSVLLAVVMIITSFAAAFPALAASNVEKAETLISNFNGIMKRDKPTAKHLAKYNDMLNAYNALSQEEIDNFDVVLFNKLIRTVYEREIVLWKAENDSSSSSQASKASHERAKAVIKMPAYVEYAINLVTSVDNIETKADADSFVEGLKNVSLNAVILAGTYDSSYGNFSKEIAKENGGAFVNTLANKISTFTMAQDEANKPAEVKDGSRPYSWKYPGGESDPDYIAAYEKYLVERKAYSEYMIKKCAFEGEKHYLGALKTIANVVPGFAYVYDIAVAAIDARRAYNETGDITVNAEVKKIYSTLSSEQKAWLAAFSKSVLCEIKVSSTSYGDEYGYNTYKINDLVNFCIDLDGLPAVEEFEKLVASIEKPYTNADIDAVKAAKAKIPSSFEDLVSRETNSKYSDILAAIQPDEISEEQPDLTSYKATDVSYSNISESNAKELANIVIDLVLKAAGVSDAKEFVNTKILTNSTVGSLAKVLYPALADLTTDFIKISPKNLATRLSEDKFAGAVAALEAANEDWEALETKNGDFGFEDGDVEGFIDAVTVMLRSTSIIHIALKFENSLSTYKGTYYGAYEDLIPILEILDLKSVMSSDDYTAYVKEADNRNDAKYRAIIAPIVYLIADFGNDPVNTICDVLPKVAYAIDSNIVNDGVNSLLSKMSMISVGPVDLTTSGVYKILNDNLLAPKGIELSKESFASLLSDLSGCGTAVSKPSVARGHAYRLGIESDRAKSVVVIMTWLLNSASDNKEFVNSLLDMLVTDNNILKSALKLLVGASATFVPKKLIFFLAMIFIHIANIYTSISKVFGR